MPAAIAGARGGQRAGERDAPDGGEAAGDGEIGSTTAQAPATRDANSAMRERPVAARSRKTSDSMSCVPDVAPMMVPMTRAARLMTSMSSLKLPSPPAGPYLAGCRRAGWP